MPSPTSRPPHTRSGRSFRRTLLAFLVALVACGPAVFYAIEAEARSGGRMGGGFRSSSRSSGSSFGGSSSRSSGSFGGSSSSYRPSYQPTYGGGTSVIPIVIPVGGGYGSGYGSGYGHGYGASRSSSSSSGFGGVLVFFLVIGGIFLLVIVFARWKAKRAGTAAEVANRIDVVQVQLGVQAQARGIQDRLERLAESVDANSDQGLVTILKEVVLELRRHTDNIEYAAIEHKRALALPAAETQFGDWSGDARSKYNREVISRDELGVRKQQKELETDGLRDEDGQLAVSEYFVVTIVAAVRGIQMPETVHDAQELQALLERLGSVNVDQLVAVEVVWSPAALSDSMARDDMESRYPELATI